MRLAVAVKTVLVMGIALRLRHHFHGPPVDYFGLAAAAAASWVGVPGPGEPVLIAAGVVAAHHQLDIGGVLVVAWLAAAGGGLVGWLIGMKAGRAVITTRGPLQGMRTKALQRGDEVFRRHPVLGVLLTPSWIAGIHRVRPRLFVPTNAVAAAVWALGIGLGAYYVGPTVVDVVDDLGFVTAGGIVLLIGAAVATEVGRRRRRAARTEPTAGAPSKRTL